MSQIQKVITTGGGGGGDVVTISGNTGGTISPDGSGNISIVGDGVTLTTSKNGASQMLITLENSVANTLTTSDTAFHQIIPVSLNIDGEAVQGIVSIVGANDDYSAVFGVNNTFTARLVNGSPTAVLQNVGAAKGNTDSSEDVLPTFQIVVSGTTISIQVKSASTGGIAETWHWKATTTFVFV